MGEEPESVQDMRNPRKASQEVLSRSCVPSMRVESGQSQGAVLELLCQAVSNPSQTQESHIKVLGSCPKTRYILSVITTLSRCNINTK